MNIIPIKPRPDRHGARQPEDGRSSRVIAVTSGKGGVGKTNVTSNLAIALARQGNRVCIFDADTNLANVNIVMGLSPRYTIEHLLNGEKTIEEILTEGPEGIVIVPAASGIAECARLDQDRRRRLIEALETLERSFDYLLIDTAAGIAESVLSFVQSAQYTILVISTEPTSLTDAFALLRMLKRRQHERPAYVLVNMALNYANSMEIFKRFEAAVKKYLQMKVHYLGYITDDKAIRISVTRQTPVLLNDPDALASRCFTTLAAVLSKQFGTAPEPHGFSHWWKALTETAPVAKEPPAPPRTPDTGLELQSIAARAHALLSDDSLTREQANRLLEPLIEVYLYRFHRLPPRLTDFGNLLARTEHSEQELRNWVEAIESGFERRFGEPLRAKEPESRQEEREQRERILRGYRIIAERLQAEQSLLHQALTRLNEYIADELGRDSGGDTKPE